MSLTNFWADPEGARYHDAYFTRFENIWHHGDFVELTELGGMIIFGRSDANAIDELNLRSRSRAPRRRRRLLTKNSKAAVSNARAKNGFAKDRILYRH